MNIFPTLINKKWANVNLDEYSRKYFNGETNLLNDPLFCQNFVYDIAEELKVDYTYGGYMELRDHLWRNHYHNPAIMRHLGVDFNVPAGTPVSVPVPCQAVFMFKDPDQKGGWGGMAVFKTNNEYLIYGHLAHNSLPTIRNEYSPGDIVGIVGNIEENGGWYEHFHVQRVTKKIADFHYQKFNEIDGYGPNNIEENENFPNPLDIIHV